MSTYIMGRTDRGERREAVPCAITPHAYQRSERRDVPRTGPCVVHVFSCGACGHERVWGAE